MKKQTYRIEDNHYKELQKKLIDNDMSFQGFVDKCVNQYLAGFYDPKDAEDFWRKEMIKKMAGKNVDIDYGWLKENDPEMIDWVCKSDYWGRGYDEMPKRNKLWLRLHFSNSGIGYIATAADEVDVDHCLGEQSYWGEDEWENWETEDIEKYYNKL